MTTTLNKRRRRSVHAVATALLGTCKPCMASSRGADRGGGYGSTATNMYREYTIPEDIDDPMQLPSTFERILDDDNPDDDRIRENFTEEVILGPDDGNSPSTINVPATLLLSPRSTSQPRIGRWRLIGPQSSSLGAAAPAETNDTVLEQRQAAMTTSTSVTAAEPSLGTLDMTMPHSRRVRHHASLHATATVDPAALLRLAILGTHALRTTSRIVAASLKLLAPLVLGRRALTYGGSVLEDWYTGRYFRVTVQQLEYVNQAYQIPSTLRSLHRVFAIICVLVYAGRWWERAMGLRESLRCAVGNGTGCYWGCAVLWMLATLGTGRIGSYLICNYAGPLRLQPIQYTSSTSSNNYWWRIWARPWVILADPDRVLREWSESRRWQQSGNDNNSGSGAPFVPNVHLFPSTWRPLTLLLYTIVAKDMAYNDVSMHRLMRQLLFQQALADEWYRVLMLERRVSLGIALAIPYVLTTLQLCATLASTSSLSAVLMVPIAISVLLSVWLNVYIYFDRLAVQQRHYQALKYQQQRNGMLMSQPAAFAATQQHAPTQQGW